MSESKNGFVDFKAVKQSVSMLQVLEFYKLTQTLKRNKDSLSGPCPLHGGHTDGQFKVSISKNCWNCFGRCKSGGNVLDFVSRKENVGIRDAAVLIIKHFNLSPKLKPKEDKEETPQQTQEDVKQSNTKDEHDGNKPLGFTLKYLDQTHPYLTELGLSQETIATFGLGYCKKGVLTDRIAIPIHNIKGELVAYVGRWPGIPPEGKEKYKFPEGFKKSLEIFNVHRAIKESSTESLIVVQSVFDFMIIWQAGLRRIVSIMGNSISDEQSTLILHAVSSQGRIVLLFNEDETAQSGCQNALMRLSPACYVKTIKFSPGERQPEHMSQKELAELLK